MLVLCSEQSAATEPVSVGSSRLCSEQPAATEPESVGSSRLCSEQPAAIQNPKVLGASRLCSEQPAVQSHRKRLTKRETNSQNETRRTEKGRRTSLHATLHSTPHITHSSMHTHTVLILFGTVSYVVSRSRHATHHTKSTSSHTPPSCFFEGRWGPILYPSRLPASPHNPQPAKLAISQTCTAATESATSSDRN